MTIKLTLHVFSSERIPGKSSDSTRLGLEPPCQGDSARELSDGAASHLLRSIGAATHTTVLALL